MLARLNSELQQQLKVKSFLNLDNQALCLVVVFCFDKHWLSTCNMPGPVLGVGQEPAQTWACPQGAYSLGEQKPHREDVPRGVRSCPVLWGGVAWGQS